jgi:hypothetical protein
MRPQRRVLLEHTRRELVSVEDNRGMYRRESYVLQHWRCAGQASHLVYLRSRLDRPADAIPSTRRRLRGIASGLRIGWPV